MRLGIRTRLFAASFGLVAAALLAANLLLAPRLDAFLIDEVRADLFARLRLAARIARDQPPPRWSALAHELGAQAGARLTLIDPAGRVLGDSEVPAERLGALESHRSRPEVEQALSAGQGTSIRPSPTLRTRMLYVALPLPAGGGGGGGASAVIRAALPLDDIDALVGGLRRAMATAALAALLGSVLLSAAAAHWTSRSLRRLGAAARAMSAGDFGVRTRLPGHDEVAALGRTLDELGRSLSESLGALRGERDLRDRILMGMGEGVLLLDRDGRVLLVNPALRAMLSLRSGAEGQPLLEAVRNAPLKDLLDRILREGGEASEEVEVLDGQARRLRVHASRLAGEGALAVLFDVTELRRLEGVRRDFVANASHELRTPIAAVRTAAETLSEVMAEDPAAAAKFVGMIQRNAARLQQLVDDLLDLSRIESREQRLSVEAVALRPVAERVVALFQDRARRRGLVLSARVPADVPPALADPRALEQILTNLVDNAVKYCSDGAEVTVGARLAGERVDLEVADSGPGIEARHLPRLFERFYRVDTSRSRELGGTGLGLSIVKHLVDSLGGAVRVESELGKGSRFVASLPRAPAAG